MKFKFYLNLIILRMIGLIVTPTERLNPRLLVRLGIQQKFQPNL